MAKVSIKAIYDMCGQLVRQANEQAAKDPEGKVDEAILTPLKESFKQIIEFEKVHLITAHDQFYGMMLMSMETDIDFRQRGPVDIKVKTQPFTVTFNPLFICSKYSYAEFTGSLIGEILKLAFEHTACYPKLNSEKDDFKHELLDKASDASVAAMIQNDIRLDGSSDSSKNSKLLRLPQDMYTAAKINNELNVTPKDRQSLEYYFSLLNKFSKRPQKMPGGGEGDANLPATSTNSNGYPTHQWEDEDTDEMKQEIKAMISNVYSNLSEKQRGFMPSQLVEQIKAILAPPQINWKQILRKLIGSVPVPHRKTRRRLNHLQPYRADLCGRLPKRLVNIVAVFDTSGSMSDRDLQYCMNEVFNILKDYRGATVTVVECDAEVNRVYQCKSIKEFKTKMMGRGGTSFVPAINFINGEKEYKNSKDPTIRALSGKFKDALMVYFTDGYGDSEIPRPKTYKNLWVVLQSEDCLSVKNPYGDVRSLSTDKDWISMRNSL